jgi:hypothetical protein
MRVILRSASPRGRLVMAAGRKVDRAAGRLDTLEWV